MPEYGKLELNMQGAPKGARLYLGLSGGLDSVYLAWRLLKAGYPMLFHLCEYRTKQKRYPKETEAQEAVLDWFISEGLKKWTVHRTMIDLGHLGYWHYDDDYLLWVAGMILKAPQHHDIKHFARASGADDRSFTSKASKRQLSIFHTQVDRKVEIIAPKKHIRKADFMADMPPELLRLTWWCRKPKADKSCGKCHTCKLVNPVAKRLGVL